MIFSLIATARQQQLMLQSFRFKVQVCEIKTSRQNELTSLFPLRKLSFRQELML